MYENDVNGVNNVIDVNDININDVNVNNVNGVML